MKVNISTHSTCLRCIEKAPTKTLLSKNSSSGLYNQPAQAGLDTDSDSCAIPYCPPCWLEINTIARPVSEGRVPDENRTRGDWGGRIGELEAFKNLSPGTVLSRLSAVLLHHLRFWNG